MHFILFSAESVGQKLHPFPGFLASVCQLRPRSRGYVRIKSADPPAAPAIHLRYLSAASRTGGHVAGMKLMRNIMSQPAITRYIDEELVPGAQVQSDADMLAFARDKGTTVFHPTSTCRMGPDAHRRGRRAAARQRLRRLRVIDGSIMPTVVSGNTNAAVIMIAEKGAAMLLADARA